MRAVDVIRKKRDGLALDRAEKLPVHIENQPMSCFSTLDAILL